MAPLGLLFLLGLSQKKELKDTQICLYLEGFIRYLAVFIDFTLYTLTFWTSLLYYAHENIRFIELQVDGDFEEKEE